MFEAKKSENGNEVGFGRRYGDRSRRNCVPEQINRRTKVQGDQKSFIIAVGEPWLSEHIEIVQKAAELRFASRTVFWTVTVFSIALAASAVALLVGEQREYSAVFFSSVVSAVSAFLGAALAHQSARSAKRVEKSLASEVSDRLRAHELESIIFVRVLEVFGDSERAIEWMRENNPALNNAPPIRVIQTEEGRREVLNVLGRIQHGVIS
jgi:putative toxin-antitoxin system antitoxin component (TIGR02293 family)